MRSSAPAAASGDQPYFSPKALPASATGVGLAGWTGKELCGGAACARTLGRDHGEALVEEEPTLPLDLVHQPEHHHALRKLWRSADAYTLPPFMHKHIQMVHGVTDFPPLRTRLLHLPFHP